MNEPQSSDSTSWYAVYCQTSRERQAARALEERHGVAVYLPELRLRSEGKVRMMPFFPRYLFVKANLYEVMPSHINATSGVVRLVSFDQTPQVIPAQIIEAIREKVDSLNASGGVPQHRFRPGEALQLKGGPLHGLEVVFVGPIHPSERVRVLLNFLGQFRETEVAANSLERIGANPAVKRERRTRGKGRRIKSAMSR